jgi:hypothetical protein
MQLPPLQSESVLHMLPTTESSSLSVAGVGWQLPELPLALVTA